MCFQFYVLYFCKFGGRILDRLNFNNIRTRFVEAASVHTYSPPEESIYLDPVSGIHPDSLSFKVSTSATLQPSEFFLLSSTPTRSVCAGRMIEINTMVIYVVNCQEYLCHYHYLDHHDHICSIMIHVPSLLHRQHTRLCTAKYAQCAQCAHTE